MTAFFHKKEAARHGLTLVELLITTGIIGILVALALPAMGRMRSVAQGAHCTNSLRQLGVATRLYLTDHQNIMFPYSETVPEGRLWYFGFESTSSLTQPEGQRVLDESKGALYPYLQQIGGVEVCPAFPYGLTSWKAKYKGASWGYGYNTFLSGINVLTLSQPSQVIVFGDCAQVNTFQAPASPKNPMLEEFYMIQNTYRTVHFRHGGSANMLFVDGHVQPMQLYPGTADPHWKDNTIGRISPIGSMQYLQ